MCTDRDKVRNAKVFGSILVVLSVCVCLKGNKRYMSEWWKAGNYWYERQRESIRIFSEVYCEKSTSANKKD